MVDMVREYVADKELPEGYRFVLWGDSSTEVRGRLDLLLRNGRQGLLLVFLVLALFLEIRLAFWVALGIPISILGAGAALALGGQTLNMLSLFSFLVALGIVVDDAIVIGENIYAHMQLGKSRVQAAIDGTVEVVPSVAASVTTTIIAFAPDVLRLRRDGQVHGGHTFCRDRDADDFTLGKCLRAPLSPFALSLWVLSIPVRLDVPAASLRHRPLVGESSARATCCLVFGTGSTCRHFGFR